ncbi:MULTISPECIES: hypothetical protein [Sorangium]|uniref:MxcI protein n=1 Tax=Sorangium cellulosum TaxID=56 RepID=A0A4P2QR55_SORCE|nr:MULTISPECIES: hypothetical protein [Sorangium]AUX32747.1 uncharacterized protein SOCE836_048940 [Sorangium cellulosum]WCQ92123.1 hypothetical protein NQZ70_04855 [Sorangium sp. Soce836]
MRTFDSPRTGCIEATLAALSLAASVAGCGSDEQQHGSAGAFPSGPLYAMTTMLQVGQDATSLLVLTPSLDDGQTIDYAQAVEIPDQAHLFGIEGGTSVYALLLQTPQLTRYDLDPSGRLEAAQELRFDRFGVAGGASTRSVHFVSERKAYLLDDTSLQAIAWDPEEMVIKKAIDLGGLKREGWIPYFDYLPKRRGNQLVVIALYYDQNFSKILPETSAALIDVETDEVTYVHDERCGGVSNSTIAPSGDLYLGSDPYNAAVNVIGGHAASKTGCLIRMRAGEDTFDPDFFVNVSDLTGGFPGGGIVPGPGSTAYLRAYDESLFAVSPATDALSLYAAAAWRWWKIDLESITTAATVVEGVPPSSGVVKYLLADSHAFATDSSADYSNTTLQDMTAESDPVKGILVKGLVTGLVRAR